MIPAAGRRAARAPAPVLGLIALIGALAVGPAGGDSAATLPAGMTYFTFLVGLDSPYSWQADCLRFSATEVCTSRDECGSWFHVEPAGRETAFAFELELESAGRSLAIEGRARVDGRAEGSSMAGVGKARSNGRMINVSLTGRSTSRRSCDRMLEEWRRYRR